MSFKSPRGQWVKPFVCAKVYTNSYSNGCMKSNGSFQILKTQDYEDVIEYASKKTLYFISILGKSTLAGLEQKKRI